MPLISESLLKRDVEANGFYILINGHYHLKRSILNSSPKELGLKHGDIITVDDEKSFGEWAHLNAIRSIEYIPRYTVWETHKAVWGTLDYLETEDNDIQIVIVNESEYRLAPYDIRCTAIVYPETTLGEIEETFGSNLNLAGKKGDLYFRIENKIYHDSKTTMAEMKIKTGDIIYVFPTPYNAYYFETIWPDDTFF